MIRLAFLYLFLCALCVTAVRYWYAALCGVVLLTVLTQHPSMPTNMFGIQGMNPWNAALLVVLISWWINRRYDPPRVPTSPRVAIMFALFVALTVLTGIVAAVDHGSVQGPGAGRLDFLGMVVNTIINPLKYVVVGVLFFDGARTRQRVKMALGAAIGSGAAYGVMLFKSMKHRVFTIDFEDARRMTDKLVGLFANDLAELFTFTMWAGAFACVVFARRWQRIGWLALMVSVLPPFIALKSRAGFLAFCAIGMTLGVLRWRKLLVVLPLVIVIAAAAVPSVRERVLMGVGGQDQETCWDEVSAGRMTNIWPPTLQQIGESPIFGHGRFAILREPCYEEILIRERYVPNHPHCSYLEIMLDAGVIGLAIVLACSAGLFRASWALLRVRGDSLITVLGCAGVAALVAELSAGLTGSSFYPSQSSIPYLCVWGAVLRVFAERQARAAQNHGFLVPS